MAIDGRLLLQRLEPAVRPGESPVATGRQDPQRAIDHRSFADLLRSARAGAIASDRLPVAEGIGEELPPESMSRIGKALDMLEAEGRDRAVIVYANRTLVANVRTRTIEGELLAHEGPAPQAVDAAVRVPTPDEDRPNVIPGPPRAVLAPPNVLELLEARDSHT
ncbi:MAG: hypothetical protein JNL80_07695 [Phycisphaerae bacterium]|nr:hypothetical protein [Phycisphaerae bacterium]